MLMQPVRDRGRQEKENMFLLLLAAPADRKADGYLMSLVSHGFYTSSILHNMDHFGHQNFCIFAPKLFSIQNKREC